MLQENDFVGYGYASYARAVTTLASHEFFHAVQAAYGTALGRVAEEGTAVWASERFAPELDDLEHFIQAYLSRADRSLVVEPDGPAQAFSYGASLFFQFLGERLGDEVLRAMWEESVRAPASHWAELLETVLLREAGTDFDTAFSEFAAWNLATGERAREGSGYARGVGYPGSLPPSGTCQWTSPRCAWRPPRRVTSTWRAGHRASRCPSSRGRARTARGCTCWWRR
ncbi:MXAN_6640 family putative metalloprotease [Cystobacter fuscus]